MIIEKKVEIKGKSPYCDLISKAKNMMSDIEEKINSCNVLADNLKNKVKLYDFWLEAFSEKGIRIFIIDQILPILNKTIVEMLEILIEGKLTLVFDNEFNFLTAQGYEALFRPLKVYVVNWLCIIFGQTGHWDLTAFVIKCLYANSIRTF